MVTRVRGPWGRPFELLTAVGAEGTPGIGGDKPMGTLRALASAESESERNQFSNADGRRRTDNVHSDGDGFIIGRCRGRPFGARVSSQRFESPARIFVQLRGRRAIDPVKIADAAARDGRQLRLDVFTKPLERFYPR